MAMEFKPFEQPELPEVIDYDIQRERGRMTDELTNSAEIDSIVSTINVYDSGSIVTFGSRAAEDISRCSDQILSSVNMSQIDDSGELFTALGRIMDKFDLKEIRETEKKGVFGRLFGNVRKDVDQLLTKYGTMGEEVDKIYIQLKKYEAEIKDSNRRLEDLFQANVTYYKLLVKYILAGEQGIRELDAHIAEVRGRYDATKDNVLQFDITSLEQAKAMLEARVMDLRIAETVAMQSVPMIKSMQFGNLNLLRKLDSAFIITLPVFKQALAQAILLKRQRIQTESMRALDARTNEMLIRNAENAAAQSVAAARLGSESAVKIETLEQTWRTIVNGIGETRAIQENAKEKRREDAERLSRLNEDYRARIGPGS